MVGGRHALVRPARRRRRLRWLALAAVVPLAWLLADSVTGNPAPRPTSTNTVQQLDDISPIAVGGSAPARDTTPPQITSIARVPERTGHVPAQTPVSIQKSPDAGPSDGLQWKRHTIRRGDALSKIFKQHGLPTNEAIRIAAHPQGKVLKRLRPGQVLELGVDRDGAVQQVRYRLDPQQALHIDLSADSLKSRTIDLELDTAVRIGHGVIDRNLFVDGAKAGLSDRVIMQLVSIFGWDVDFALDLRKGDRFTVAYEELYDGERKVGTKHILAAEFVNRDRVLRAFRHIDPKGRVEYYDAQGNNLRGTFLRTPMKISRITSGFNKRRYHPVLKKWRAHRGIDYGAPTGTPVLATADGRISFSGQKGGYGKCMILRHGGKYSTLYAHLSRFRRGLRSGSRVRQGQVIGYVGSTGLATGPHLHYEFRVNNQHRNPLTHTTAKAQPIAEKYKAEFIASAQMWTERLAQHSTLQIAAN